MYHQHLTTSSKRLVDFSKSLTLWAHPSHTARTFQHCVLICVFIIVLQMLAVHLLRATLS